jgi:hypothetical protein
MTYALRLSDDELARYRLMAVVIDAFRGWFEIAEWPSGMRGAAWAAREAMVRAGLAAEEDLARWAAAFDEIDSWTERPQFMVGVFGAVRSAGARKTATNELETPPNRWRDMSIFRRPAGVSVR